LTIPEATDATIAACEELGLLAGYLIATQARTTDLYNLHRRHRALSLAASMQWDLLPPLVLKTPSVTVAGMLEPAYEVGGDCFDYALNGHVLSIALMDAMGHGVGSALISALAIGSYRHDRREGRSLERTHTIIDEVITQHCPPFTFATGQLAELDIDSGALTWTNAGHPLPLLVREGSVIGELECAPTLPWGLGSVVEHATAPTVANESLQPGDSVLFYTDGTVDAHSPGGDLFGVERLADLVGRHASDQLEPEEIVRRIVRSVLDHKVDELVDDATLLLVRWNGPSETRVRTK
jgi:serine phosphatase RsbU (regulator of sigma subunit)